MTSLDEALQTLPATRPDALQRAVGLVSNSNYPPADVLNRVSELLADKLTSGQ